MTLAEVVVDVEDAAEPTLEDVREALAAAYGTDYDAHSPTWVSRFTDMSRQAVAYREGRILIAGDAAHVHGPQGGQGLNIGVQDAVNLGSYDEIIVSTLPPRISRWLKLDLVSKARGLGLPVTHVEATSSAESPVAQV